MCIIIYKPEGKQFPSKDTLRTCFENNPDGAGFMLPYKDSVRIYKGFMSFESFYTCLEDVRDYAGDNTPYVLHFRITTQAGVRADCTHPYPIARDMDVLRLLRCRCNIGVAHNGIINLTSTWGKKVTYNDTMQYITDYLALLIKDRRYYKDADTLQLIERTCKSKLAIMDGSGKTTLIGEFITDELGVFYSNSSYKATPRSTYAKYYFDEDDYPYCTYYDTKTKSYKSIGAKHVPIAKKTYKYTVSEKNATLDRDLITMEAEDGAAETPPDSAE